MIPCCQIWGACPVTKIRKRVQFNNNSHAQSIMMMTWIIFLLQVQMFRLSSRHRWSGRYCTNYAGHESLTSVGSFWPGYSATILCREPLWHADEWLSVVQGQILHWVSPETHKTGKSRRVCCSSSLPQTLGQVDHEGWHSLQSVSWPTVKDKTLPVCSPSVIGGCSFKKCLWWQWPSRVIQKC